MEKDFRQKSIFIQVIELVYAMYRYNKNLKFTHPYQSDWWQWPLCLAAPILIWTSSDFHSNQLIAIFNNHATAYSSLIGFIILLIEIIIFSRKFKFVSHMKLLVFPIGYFFSYALFIFISRCTFSYHYTIPLIFGLLCLGEGINMLRSELRNSLFVCIVLIMIICYIYFFPCIYGSYTPNGAESRLWLWKEI